MASLESLPADQRAVLQLVLQRHRSYYDIAGLLRIDPAAVRDRAHAAVDALGPQTGVPDEQRILISDYLLGQLSPGQSDEARDRLAESASERAWARVVASQLAPLASGPLPEIPAEASAAAAVTGPPTVPEGPPTPPEPAAPPAGEHPRSRVGGAILLVAGALVAIGAVIAAVLVLSDGSSNKHSSSASRTAAAPTPSTAATTTSTSSTASTSAHVVAQINLNPPDTHTHSKAAGIADVLRQGTVRGLAIAAQGLTPNAKHPPNAYAVWLYNSARDNHILGFVNPGVGANGRLQTAGALPSNAGRYKQLIVTLETQANPHAPGKVVLQGSLNLG
jgi:hypothetical protein